MTDQNNPTPVKKVSPPRTRFFACIIYDDPASFEIDKDLHEVFRAIAWMRHDKDVYDEDGERTENGVKIKYKKGDPKPLHWHVLGITSEKHTAKTVTYSLAHLPQNVMVEACINREKAFDYLTHKNNPDKYQYDKKDMYIEPEVRQRFKGLKGDNREFIEDMQSLSMRELAYTYGRDVMRNYRAYRQYLDLMEAEEESHVSPFAGYSYDPAEKAAMDAERAFIAYRIGSDGRKKFVHASDEGVRACITLALSIAGWKEYDRILIVKLKTSSYQEYYEVLSMGYVEAMSMFAEVHND